MADNSNQIEITFSKDYLLVAMASCMSFFAVCVGLLIHRHETDKPLLTTITGLAGIAFWGAGFVFLLRIFIQRLRNVGQGLIISDEGITDNITGISTRFIPWGDIVSFKEGFRTIDITVQKEYVNRQLNPLKGAKLWLSSFLYGKPVVTINSYGLDCKKGELLEMLEKRHEEVSNRKP